MACRANTEIEKPRREAAGPALILSSKETRGSRALLPTASAAVSHRRRRHVPLLRRPCSRLRRRPCACRRRDCRRPYACRRPCAAHGPAAAVAANHLLPDVRGCRRPCRTGRRDHLPRTVARGRRAVVAAPAAPAVAAAPAIAAAPGVAAPIPARSAPAVIVPTIVAAAEDERQELRLLDVRRRQSRRRARRRSSKSPLAPRRQQVAQASASATDKGFSMVDFLANGLKGRRILPATRRRGIRSGFCFAATKLYVERRRALHSVARRATKSPNAAVSLPFNARMAAGKRTRRIRRLGCLRARGGKCAGRSGG